MQKKILDFIRTNWFPILVIVCAGVAFLIQSNNNTVERRLLERDFAVLQSDIATIKTEQQNLGRINEQLIIHATNLNDELVKYGTQIDELGKLNAEDRRLFLAIRQELSTIRTDIGATKTELSTSITGLRADIESIRKIGAITTENGTIYDEMDRRLRELAERYGIDLTK